MFVTALMLSVASGASVAEPCAPSVEEAVQRMLTHEVSRAETGFKVIDIRVDAIHHRTWAVVASCAEDGRPHVAVALPESFKAQPAQVVAVRAGETVRVLAGGDSRMELYGVAEESAAAGREVRVRLSGDLFGHGTAAQPLRVRVLAAGVVEMMR